MRKIIVIFILSLFFGCSQKENKAESCANGFLKAFIENDYAKAAEFCNADIASKFIDAAEQFNNLDSTTRAVLVKMGEDLSYEIKSVERREKTDSVKVTYHLLKVVKGSATEQQSNERLKSGTLVIVNGIIEEM